MELRLGELLVDRGVLTPGQVDHILHRQSVTAEPFGRLAETMFGVDPEAVEAAWAGQYARLTRTIDPAREDFDPAAIRLVSRRQAWQFRVLPIRFDPMDLLLVTTEMHLQRALRFATNVLGVPACLVLADPLALGRALVRHRPMDGMGPEAVLGATGAGPACSLAG